MGMGSKGVSLIEILVALSILSILGAIAYPNYTEYLKNSVKSHIKADVSSAQKYYVSYGAVNNSFCASFNSVGYKASVGDEYNPLGWVGFNQAASVCNISDVTKIQKTADSSAQVSSNCDLDEQKFKLGAYSNNREADAFYAINQRGDIEEDKSLPESTHQAPSDCNNIDTTGGSTGGSTGGTAGGTSTTGGAAGSTSTTGGTTGGS